MKKKIIIPIVLLPIVILVDFSVTEGVGSSTFPQGRFAEFRDIGIIRIVENEGKTFITELKKGGEYLTIEITRIEHSIPASMYLPIYRYGYMSSSLTFKAYDTQGNEVNDRVLVEQEITKYGLFFLPDLSLKENLESKLREALSQGVETRLNENSNQTVVDNSVTASPPLHATL